MVVRWWLSLLVGLLALLGLGCTMDVSVKDLNPAAGGISISINEVTITEGQTGALTVSLSAPATSNFLITYYTQDDTAVSTAPQDFAAILGVLTIAQGQQVASLPVSSTDDAWYEGAEQYRMVFVPPAGLTMSASMTQRRVIIQDNENRPRVSIADASVIEGGTLTFTITTDVPAQGEVVFDFATSAGTQTDALLNASSPSDFGALAGRITLASGTTSTTVNVATVSDAMFERDEQMVVTLSGLQNADALDVTAVGTIINDDGQPTISIADLSITEGDTAAYVVSLSAPSAVPVPFTLTTTPGTASANVDYTSLVAVAGTIPAGTLSIVRNLVTLEDSLDEPNETFSVQLGGVSDATVGAGTATITILDDDLPTLSVADATVVEGGTLNFVVSLSGAALSDVTFNFTTVAGTASAGADFTSVGPGSATISTGASAITIAVPSLQDAIYEGSESLSLNLSAVTNATGVDLVGAGQITDDESQPSLSIADVSVIEGDVATVAVTMSGPSAFAVTFNWQTMAGTALAGSDFVSHALTAVTLAPLSTSLNLTVATVEDSAVEPTEMFAITLSSASGAAIADGSSTITINDDDLIPFTWTGLAGDGLWTTAANWSSTVVPGASEVANFNNTCVNCGVLIPANTSVGGINMAASFSGAITQAAGNSLSVGAAGWTMAGGSFVGGNAPISASGVVSISGGAFTATSATMTLNNSFYVTGGTFSHNSGTVDLSGGGGYALSIGGLTLNKLRFSHANDITVVGSPTVASDLELTGTGFLTGGAIWAAGNVIGSGSAGIHGSTPIRFVGTGAQSLDMSSVVGGGQVPSIEIAKPSGTLSLFGRIKPYFRWEYISGTVNAGTSMIDFGHGYGLEMWPGTVLYNDLRIAAPGPNGFWMYGGLPAQVSGTLTFDGSAGCHPINSAFQVTGNVVGIGAACTGDSAVSFTSASTSTVSLASGAAPAGSWTINKSGGQTDLLSAVAMSSGSDVTMTAGTVNMNGRNWTGIDVLGMQAGTVINTGCGTLGYTTLSPALGTINGGVGSPNITIADASVAEGGTLAFTVSLSAPRCAGNVTMNFATSNGTATAGSDYTAATGVVTFSPGQTSRTINVVTLVDATPEGNETLNLTLSSATGGTLLSSSAVGTILNDDFAGNVWTGAVNNDWNVDGNWQDGSRPTSAEIAYFVPGACAGAACNAATTGALTIEGLHMLSGYTGVVTQGNFAMTVGTSDFLLESGSFAGSAANVQFNRDFVQSGGSFVSGAQTITARRNFTQSAGSLSLTGSEVRFTGASVGSISLASGAFDRFYMGKDPWSNMNLLSDITIASDATLAMNDNSVIYGSYTISVGGNVSLIGAAYLYQDSSKPTFKLVGAQNHTLSVAGGGFMGLTLDTTGSVSFLTDVSVGGDFTITNSGPISTNGFALRFIGNNSATITSNGRTFPKVDFQWLGTASKTISGALTVTGDLSVDCSSAIMGGIQGGVVDVLGNIVTLNSNPAGNACTGGYGTVRLSGPGNHTIVAQKRASLPKLELSTTGSVTTTGFLTLGNGFEYINAGAVDFSGSTVEFYGETGSPTISSGSVQFNDVIFDRAFNSHISVAGTMSIAGDLGFISTFGTHTYQVSGGMIAVAGDVSLTTGKVTGGNTALSLVGTNAQTITRTAGTWPTGTWTINKGGGTVEFASNISLSAGQDVTMTAGTVNMNGFNWTGIDVLGMQAGTVINTGCGTLGYTTLSPALGTINGGVGSPNITISDYSANEGNSGSTTFPFTVNLSGPYCGNLTVNYATAHGTTNGSDYTSASGTLTFSSGQTSRVINVSVTGDAAMEPTETFNMNLSAASAGTITDAQGVGTIVNDDTGNYMWTGLAGDGKWSTPGNWIGGVPGSGQTAVFNNLCTNCNANIDVTGVDIGNLRLDPGYSGTLTQVGANTLSIGSTLTIDSGTLVTGSGQISINDHILMRGGSFQGGSNTIWLENDLTVSGGTFSPGTTTFDFGGASSSTVNMGSARLHHVRMSKDWSQTLTTVGTMFVDGNLTLQCGTANGCMYLSSSGADIEVKGNANFTNFGGGWGTIRLTGSGTQTVTGTGGGLIPSLEIASTGTVNLVGTIVLSRNWTYTSGVVNAGASTVEFTGGSPSTVVAGPMRFANMIWTKDWSQWVQVSGSVTVDGNLTLQHNPTNGGMWFNTGTVELKGNLIASGFGGGWGSIRLSGAGTQTVTGSAGGVISNLIIDSLGSVNLSGTIDIDRELIYVAGVVDPGTSTVRFTTGSSSNLDNFDVVNLNNLEFRKQFNTAMTIVNGPVNVLGQLVMNQGWSAINGSGINSRGNISLQASGGGNAPISFLGTGVQTISRGAGDWPTGTWTINKGGGTVEFASAITLSAGQDVTMTAGTVNMNGNNWTGIDILGMQAGTVINTGCGTLGYTTLSPALGTINGGAGSPSISIADASVTEGGTLAFNVTLSAPRCAGNVTMNFATSNGTTSGGDYTATSGVLTFSPGQTLRTINVVTTQDATVEGNETLNLTLSAASGGTFADNIGVGTILNDDVSGFTWTGATGDGLWSTAGNWANNTVPSTTAHTARFAPGACSGSNCNATINQPVSINSIQLLAGYSGTVAQGAAQSVATVNDLVVESGAFTGTSGAINVGRDLIQRGGALTATSGTMEIFNDLTFSGGTFAHNSGLVKFTDNSNVITPGSAIFNDLEFTHGFNYAASADITGTLVVADDLTINALNGYGRVFYGGVINIGGDLIMTRNDSSYGDTIFRLNGVGTQNISSPTLTHISNLEIAATGSVNLTGNIGVGGNWTYVSGTVLAGTSTVTFSEGGSIVNSAGMSFNDVHLNLNVGSGWKYLDVVGEMDVNGKLRLEEVGSSGAHMRIDSGTIRVAGNVELIGAAGGAGTIRLDGSGTQTISGSGTDPCLPNIIFGSTGIVNLTGTIGFCESLTYVSGTVVPGTSTVAFVGNENTITSSGMSFNNVWFMYDVGSGWKNSTVSGAMDVNGSLLISQQNSSGANSRIWGGPLSVAGNITMAGGDTGDLALVIDGSGTQTITRTGGIWPTGTWTINKGGGTVEFASAITLSAGQDETMTAGTVNMNGFNWTGIDVLGMQAGTVINTGCGTLGYTTLSPALGTINNGAGSPSISIADASVVEGGTLAFNVTLSAPRCAGNVTMNFASSNGTATTGNADYTATSGVLTFTPGQTARTINVVTGNDATMEPNETMNMTLSAATNGTFADNLGIGTIVNNDTGNFMWTGLAGDGLWTTAGNWIGGVPGAANTAIFNNMCTNCNASINTAISIGGIRLDNGYTGTLSQGAGQTIYTSGQFRQQSGSFSGSNAAIQIGGVLNISGGSFASTSAQLRVEDDVTIASGTFSHNGGEVWLNDVTGGNHSFSGTVFNDLRIDHGWNLINFGSSTLSTQGKLYLINGQTSGGTITALGNIDVGSPGVAYSSTVRIAGTGGQVLDATPSGSRGTVPRIEIAKTAGALTVVGGIELADNWTYQSGTINMAASTIYMSGVSGGTITPGPFIYNNLVASGGSNPYTISGAMTISGNFEVPSPPTNPQLQGGPLRVLGNLSVQGDAWGGLDIELIGSANQTADFSLAPANAVNVPELIVNKSGGTVTFLGTIAPYGRFEHVAGSATLTGTTLQFLTPYGHSFTPGSLTYSTVKFIGQGPNGISMVGGPAPVTGVLQFGAAGNNACSVGGGSFSLSGHLESYANGCQSWAAIDFTGATVSRISLTGANLPDGTWTVSKTGGGRVEQWTNVSLASSGQDLTLNTGSYDMRGFNLSINDRLTLAAGTTLYTGCGALTYGALTNNGTIVNGSNVQLSVADGAVGEGAGSAPVVVSLSAPSCASTVFSYATSNNTATSGQDYTATSGSATIAAGSGSITINVPITDDGILESAETLNFTVSAVTGAGVADNLGVITINDNEVGPVNLSVNDVSVTEGGTLNFVASISPLSSSAVTFNFATADGTATTANSDYTARTGVATIPAMSDSVTIAVVTTQDTSNEPDETLALNLSGVSGATLLDGTGIGTILNDDAPVLIFRSVGPGNNSPLADGVVLAQSMAISGTTATFGANLPLNVGVGDAIVYDCSNNGSLGASDCVAFIHGRTSGNIYSVRAASGGTPTAYASANVWRVYRAYTSLANAETGSENSAIAALNATLGNFDTWSGGRNLVTNNEQWSIALYADAALTTGTTISGWTTSSSNFLKVYAPSTASEVGISQRHDGVWSDLDARIVTTGTTTPLSVQVGNVRVEGLQLKVTNPSGISVVNMDNASATSVSVFAGNLVTMSGTCSGGSTAGLYIGSMNSSNARYQIYNNIIYDICPANSGLAVNLNARNFTYNNTVYNAGTGIQGGWAVSYSKLVNNIVQATTGNAYVNQGMGWESGTGFNISDDATVTSGSNDRANRTIQFQDATARDLRLSPADSEALGNGTALSGDADLPFNVDLASLNRPQGAAWDIGAAEVPNQIFVDDEDSGGEFGAGSKTNVAWDSTTSALAITQYTTAEKSLSNPDGLGFNTANLFGIWRFDEGTLQNTGTTADVSGNNYTGSLTITGSPSNRSSAGEVNGAIYMDGSGDCVLAGEPSGSVDMGPISGMAWIDMQGSGFNGWGTVISKSNLFYANGWSFGVNGGSGGGFGFRADYATTDLMRTMAWPSGGWQHVAFTWDGTSNKGGVRIYLNGQEVTTYNQNQDGGGARISDSGFQIGIGCTAGWTTPEGNWDGRLDEVILFKRVLTSGEILNIYNRAAGKYKNGTASTFTSRVYDSGSLTTRWYDVQPKFRVPYDRALPVSGSELVNYSGGANTASMIGHWRFDMLTVASGTTINPDLGGTSGTYQCNNGGANKSVTGRFGSGLEFDGSGDRLPLTDNAIYTLDLSQSRSWSFWVKPTSFREWSNVWAQIKDTDEYFLIYAHTTADANNPTTQGVGVYLSSVNDKIFVHSNGYLLPTTSFTHVTVTYTPSGNLSSRIKIYINGEDMTAVGLTNGTMTTQVIDPTETTFGGNVTWGEDGDLILDEFTYWNKTLSAQEARDLAARGLARAKVQVRSCSLSSCAGVSWRGFDGTSTSFFTEALNWISGKLSYFIPLSEYTNRYFQYQLTLESDSPNTSPELQRIDVRGAD